MRRRPRLVGLLWRWHRRLGLFAALLAILLALTGIGLNHSMQWGLDQRFVEAPWLYSLYGEKRRELPAYRAADRWLYRDAEGQVYVDAVALAPCQGELVGAQALDGLLYVACAGELLLATAEGVLVESMTPSMGLPLPLEGVGQVEGRLALRAGGEWRLADVDQLSFADPLPERAIIEELAPGSLPADLQSQIPLRDRWLSWERVLLDLHSGRLGGAVGVWLVDLAGVAFCLLGLSGVAMWWLHRRGGRGARQSAGRG